MRHTRAHTKNRRSHHALKTPALLACSNCKASKEPHRACANCGQYKGKIAFDPVARVEKKQAKRKAKEQAAA